MGDRLVWNHAARFPNSTTFGTATRCFAQVRSDGQQRRNCAETLSRLFGNWDLTDSMVRRHCKAVRDRSHAVQQLSRSRRPAPE